MAVIPPHVIEEIKSRADIVELVSGYIPLKKAGANYRALCPFHEEKTPSFNVNPEKKIFHCFGCGVGGDSIGFIMKFESLSYPEAVRSLAKRYGVAIPESAPELARAGFNEKIYSALEMAARFYRKQLAEARPDSAPARYLDRRAVSGPMRELFGLGWAPDQWDSLTRHLLAEGFDKKILETAGLSKESSTGGLIDRFRARIIFPICDMQGRPIGFGGRVLEETSGGPKYLNSPETPVYNKSKVLYGLNLAASSARKLNSLIIVEGYMDVIALRGGGIENCAAVSGTAFTEAQAKTIKRVCDNVTAFFDSDKAGLAAAKKSLPALLDSDLKAKVLTLPGVKDADEFLKEKGAEELEKLLRAAPSFPQFVIDAATAAEDLATVEGRARAIREVIPYINRIKDRIERDQYVQILSDKTKVDLESLKKEVGAHSRGAPSPMAEPMAPKTRTKPRPGQAARAQAERLVIRILLDRPEYLDGPAAELGAGNFEDEENKKLFELILEAMRGGATGPEGVMELARQRGMQQMVTARSMEPDLYDAEKGAELAVVQCARALQYRPDERKKRLEEMKSLLAGAGGEDKKGFEDAKNKYIKSRKDRLI
ncbi:MAG: DNA primase [Nitrospinota bacterium]|nr:DNA primase [Nitrospinota bacterium]